MAAEWDGSEEVQAPAELGRRRFRRITWPIVGLLVILVAGAGAFLATGPAVGATGKCVSCHPMAERADALNHSAHTGIDCTTCHSPALGEGTVRVAEMTARYVLGNYEEPIRIKDPIPNQVCKSCHPTLRDGLAGDVKTSHTAHLKRDTACTNCHNRTSHETIQGYDNGFAMTSCLVCHNGVTASRDCLTCHTKDLSAPKSHNTLWMTNHGPEAVKDPNACQTCHSWNAQFCSDCHKRSVPTSHKTGWIYTHAPRAANAPQECQVCHQQALCDRCHGPEHPPKDPLNHPIAASQPGAQCYTCHPSDYCSKCHTGGRVNQ